MRVVHIISDISRKSGGPARSSQGLVVALNQAGVDAWLVTCTCGEEPWVEGLTQFRAPTNPGWIAFWRFIKTTLQELKPDLVHIHNLWSPKLHLCVAVARSLKIPYVIAPRGTLEPWSLEQKKWKKRIGMWLYQKWDLKRAVALHATAESEANRFRALGFTQPIILSPNGVLVPDVLPEEQKSDEIKTALFLSRLHPGKGLMTLAEAWGKVRPQGWRMRVVGFDNYGERPRVEKRLEELGITDWIFEGAMNDEEKWHAYRDANLFIHPSVSENFGISIAEALYAGLPVITTRGTPWKELETYRCGWWIDIGVEPLAEALKEAMGLSDEERQAMGSRGHQLIEEKYTWPAIGRKMAEAYRELGIQN